MGVEIARKKNGSLRSKWWHWWETLRTPEQWEQVALKQWQWRSSVSLEEKEVRQETTHEMGLALLFLLSSLTQRQRQVVELYCLEGRTQVEVATILGITQPTVSMHLTGKLRGGHHVGGAFCKIRRVIRKKARLRAGEATRHAKILAVFNELLDSTTTRCRAFEIVGTLARRGHDEA